MWYKLHVRVGLNGMRLSSGNFAIMYFNSTTNDWFVQDHESGGFFTRSDIVDMRKTTTLYDTAKWCDSILMAADLIMHEKVTT